MKIHFYLAVLLLAGLLPVDSLALESSDPASEWELKVLAEKANIYTEPDTKSPVVTTVAKGTVLESYERQNVWFRVIIKSELFGFLLVGELLVQRNFALRDIALVETTQSFTPNHIQIAGDCS